MSLTPAMIDAMLAAGCTAEQIAAVVKASLVDEDARLTEKREKDAERQRRSRANRAMSRNVTVTPCDSRDECDNTPLPAPSPSFPPNPQTNPTPTHPRDNTPCARKADQFPCPDGVDPMDWSALIANRKAKRAALSEGAHRQIIAKLDGWSRAGWPPGPIVACAAERGWTTVFETDEMKGQANGNDRQSGVQRTQRGPRVDGFTAALREAAGRETDYPLAGNG